MANEQHTAERFVREVLHECRIADVERVTFVAVLDRACKDGTRSVLERLAIDESDLRIIWAPENRTVVDAYTRGYREALAAGCDWILEIDAGYSHHPKDIPQFFREMIKGSDCVFGSRFCKGGSIKSSPRRHLISKGGTVLSNLLLGTRLTDMTSGFELFSREALTAILAKGVRSRGHFFQTEMKAYCRDLEVVEVPIRYETGSDSVTNGVLVDAARNLLRLIRMRLTSKLSIR